MAGLNTLRANSPDNSGRRAPNGFSSIDIALLAASFILLNAAQWLARAISANASFDVDYIVRLFVVLLLFLGAMAFWKRPALPASLADISAAAGAVFFLVPFFSLVENALPTGGDVPLLLEYMRKTLSSIGYALCIAALTAAMASCRRFGLAAAVASCLGTQTLFFALSFLPLAAIEALRPLIRLAAAVLLCLFWYRRGALRLPWLRTSPAAVSKEAAEQASADKTPSDTEVGTRPHPREDRAVVLAATALFPCLFCIASQLLGSGGFEMSLYDPACEIGAIGFLACLLAGSGMLARHLTPGLVVAVCLPLYATGYLLLPSTASAGILLSRMAIKLGFAAFQALAFALLLDMQRKRPERTFAASCLFWGTVQASKVLGRGIVLALPISETASSVWPIALGGLYATGLVGAALVAYLYAACSKKAPLPLGNATPAQEERPTSEPTAALISFSARHGLSSRECDVLGTALRGYGVREIAADLAVSQGTVKTHLHNLYRKCDVADRQQLIQLFERDSAGDRH